MLCNISSCVLILDIQLVLFVYFRWVFYRLLRAIRTHIKSPPQILRFAFEIPTLVRPRSLKLPFECVFCACVRLDTTSGETVVVKIIDLELEKRTLVLCCVCVFCITSPIVMYRKSMSFCEATDTFGAFFKGLDGMVYSVVYIESEFWVPFSPAKNLGMFIRCARPHQPRN